MIIEKLINKMYEGLPQKTSNFIHNKVEYPLRTIGNTGLNLILQTYHTIPTSVKKGIVAAALIGSGLALGAYVTTQETEGRIQESCYDIAHSEPQPFDDLERLITY